MVKKRGQITVEYFIIFSFVLVVMIPVIYYAYTQISGVYYDYQYNNLDNYMKKTLDKAELVYYYGLYSKLTIKPSVSPRVLNPQEVFTMRINTTPGEYNYYLIAILRYGDANRTLAKLSNVPIIGNVSTCNSTASYTSNFFPECGTQGNCTICHLDTFGYLAHPLELETDLTNETELIVNLRNV